MIKNSAWNPLSRVHGFQEKKKEFVAMAYYPKKTVLLLLLSTRFFFCMASSESLEEIKMVRITTEEPEELSFEEGCKLSLDKHCDQWHREEQAALSRLDEIFYPPGYEVKHKKNLALLGLSIYFADGTFRWIDFKPLIFISGIDTHVPPLKLGALDDLSGRKYRVTLEECPSSGQNPPSEAMAALLRRETFLARFHEETQGRYLMCIEDFYENLSAYRKSLVEYFDLTTVLGNQHAAMEGSFSKSLEDYCSQKGSLVSQAVYRRIQAAIKSMYVESLTYAPFDEPSKSMLKDRFDLAIDEGDELDTRVNFCDSEQAIRLLLSDYGKGLLTSMKDNARNGCFQSFSTTKKSPAEICRIEIHIASRRYMCRYCQKTYHYDIAKKEKGQLLAGILKNIYYAFISETYDALVAKLEELCEQEKKNQPSKRFSKAYEKYLTNKNRDQLIDTLNNASLEIKTDDIREVSEQLVALRAKRGIAHEEYMDNVEVVVFVSGSIPHAKQ